MKLFRSAIVLVPLIAADPCRAQADEVPERIFEITPFAGALLPDDNAFYGGGSALAGFRAAINNSPRWSLEGTFALSPGQTQSSRSAVLESYVAHPQYNSAGQPTGGFAFTDMQISETADENGSNLLLASGGVLMHLSQGRFRPFVVGGLGFLEDLSNDGTVLPSPFSDLFWDLGVGFKYYRRSGWALRLDLRDHIMLKKDLPQANPRAAILAAQRDIATFGGSDGVFGREPYRPDSPRGKRWLNNYSVSLSLTVPFGWVWKDGDGDMIEDRFDQCLTTAPRVVVDPMGCGLDTDGDGVMDGLDVCGGTPAGATVDVQGCPSDTDGDKVFDGIDQCADTPVGAFVNAQGCPSDTDEDGILDGLDQCNDTPLGALIDDKGCVKNPMEAQLLLRKRIVVEGVEFDSGSEDLRPLSYHYVNKVGRLLERWTGHEERPLRIELGVHTDGIGADRFNQELSQHRAERIRTYLLERFSSMGQNNLVALGYGESFPVGDDRSDEGRSANRRLEILVVGEGDEPELFQPAAAGGGGLDLNLDDLDLDDLDLDLDALDDIEMPDLDGPEMPELDEPDFPADDDEE